MNVRRASAALLASLLVALSATPALAHDGIDWRTNRFRVDSGRPALRTSSHLHDLARQRVRELSRSWGHDFGWWSDMPWCRGVGENIAYRAPSPSNPGRWFFRAWRDSPPHREVMLGRWSVMASSVYERDGAMWGVQLFCLR